MDDVDDVDDGSQFTRWTALPTPPSGPCISKQSLAIAESAVGECRSVNCAPPLSAVPALTVMGCPDYPDRWDRPDVAASVRNGARRRCGHCRCCCRGRGRGYGGWRYAPAAGWTTAAAVLVVGTWGVIAPMSAGQTAAHATRENPARAMTDLIVLVASVASLAGVVYLLAAGSSGHGAGEAIAAGLGILSVAGAWAVVHTMFTLRYALLYYIDGAGGIEFNQSDPPEYVDFAYLAFTLGMTYRVSDTDLKTHPIRTTALRHGLLSYLLGRLCWRPSSIWWPGWAAVRAVEASPRRVPASEHHRVAGVPPVPAPAGSTPRTSSRGSSAP